METFVVVFVEAIKIMKIVGVIMILAFMAWIFIYGIVSGEWGDEVKLPWEKEERKQAKERERAERNRKWYE